MEHFNCDKIQYEGADSKNALSFKHYNATEEVGGKAMKDHLRFGAAYWHVIRNELADPFGAGTEWIRQFVAHYMPVSATNWRIHSVQVPLKCLGMTRVIP